MERLEDFYDEHPYVVRTLCGAALIAATILGLLALPENGLTRATGITAAQRRVSAVGRALYWSVRANIHPSSAVARSGSVYGTLLGVDEDGRLLVQVPVGDEYVIQAVATADIRITDLPAAARAIELHRFADVRMDMYAGEQAVVWMGERPLNLVLIEVGAAKADPSPPTNIVDSAFAAYYWRQAKLGEVDHVAN